MRRGNPHTIKGKGFDAHPENINRKGQPRKLPELAVLMAEGVSQSDLLAIIKAMSLRAKKGDTRAADFVFDRGYGKPKQSTDVTTNGKDLTPQTIIVKDQQTANNLTELKKRLHGSNDSIQ